MKKLYGAYNIAKFLGKEKIYVQLAVILQLCNAPKVINDRGINTYCITEAQAETLKVMLESMKKVFNEK